MVIKVERLPRPGETVLGGNFLMAPGGKGANQAVAAARAGGAVEFVARVGQDHFGTRAVAGLAAEGVGVEWVLSDEQYASGVALICVAANGENSIAVATGANARLSPADVARAQSVIAGTRLVLLQLETPLPAVQAAVELAARAGVPVLLNPAPAQSLPDTLLQRISVLTLNETETELLTGTAVTDMDRAAQAARQLHQRGVRRVILTLGARGVLVLEAGLEHWELGLAVEAVDATGAGDVFNGALAVALAEGRPLREAARFANAAAAISVTRWGAQSSAPYRREIESLLGGGILAASDAAATPSPPGDVRWPAGPAPLLASMSVTARGAAGLA